MVVAVKTAKENTEDASRHVMNQANILATCDHTNIIQLYGICSGPPTSMIIEYMSLGNLLQFLRNLEEQSNLITELEDLTYIAVQVLNITLTLTLHSLNSSLSTFVLQLPVQSVPITTKVVSSNPVHDEVYSIQHYVIKFVSDLRQVGGFLQVLLFPPPIKLTATI